jgi:autotransporter translocation and assembly factor TamB
VSAEPPNPEPGTPPARLPRRWRRRLRRALHALILTVVVLIVAAVGVSQTAWFKDWLRRDMTARAERLLDARLSIGRVGGNLFTGIVLDDVRLMQAGVPVVTIDRVRVTYRVLTMRRNRIVLDSIELLRPTIVARQTAEGWNVTRLVKPRVRPTGAAPIAFGIDALRIYDGRVSVEPRGGRRTRLEDLDADLSIATGAGVARYAIRSVSLTLPDRALRLGRFAGVIERRGDVVSFADTRLDLPRSHLRIAGAIRGGAAPGTYDLTVGSGAFAFDEMNRLIPWVPARPVQARFDATVRGPLERLVTGIDFRSTAGDARGDVTIGREDDPGRALVFGGALELAHVDPAVWANTPAVAGRVTGHALFTVAPPVASRQLPIRGTFTLTRAVAQVAGYEARDASAEGRFDGPRVTLRRARGLAYGGRFDTHGTIGPRDPGQRGVRFALEGRVAGMDVRRLPPPVPRLRLATDISGTFAAHLDGPIFDATMTFDDSTVEGGRVRAGSIGTFGLAPGEIRYGATARIEALDLGRLGAALDLALLQDPRVAGPITGDVDVRMQGRTIPTLAMTASAKIERATVAGGEATGTTLQARIADRRLDVDLEGDVAHVDPAVAASVPAAEGDVSGHVRGHFSIADLSADSLAEQVGFTGDVTLGPSRVAGRDITSASMTLALAGGVLGISRLTAVTPAGDLTASGPLALNASGETDLAYAVKGLPLAQFTAQLGDVAGTVDVEGRLRGPRAALVTEGTARFTDVRIGTAADGLAGSTPFTVHLPEWDVERARVEARPVLSSGIIGGVELETGEAQVAYAGRRATFDVLASAGDRRVHAAGVADLSDPAQRTIALREAGLSFGEQTWVLDGARTPEIVIGADEIRVRNVHFDDGTGQIVEAAGTYALRAPAESSLHVSVRGLDLLPIEELLGQEDPEFAGLLNAVARVTGPAGRPDVLGSFAIQRGRYRELQFERVAGAVSYAQRRIGVEVIVEQAPGVTLAVNGSVPTALFTDAESKAADAEGGNAPIDLNIESSAIGLQVVTGLTRSISDVTGTATVKLHVTGTADNPLFDGGVALAGGGFTVPATGRRYRDLATTVRFEPGRMHVDSLRVLDEEGDVLEVGGVLGLRRLAFGDVQMKAKAQRFGFVRNDLARLEVDLDLDVTGQVTRPTIVGTAAIVQGQVEVDRVLASLDRTRVAFGPDDGVPIVGRGQKPAPPPEPERQPVPVQAGRREGGRREGGRRARAAEGGAAAPGTGTAAGGGQRETRATPWTRTALDIRVQIPETLLLRGQNIRRDSAAAGLGNVSLVVGGDFRVQKERRQPTTLVGTITTARGSYEYYGRRFEILRDGRIQFTGGPEIDPALDVTARRIIEPSGVEARIRVQGTARNPTLSFSSTPPLDESDILALIVFNRELNSLGASEKGAVATMAGTAAAGMVVSPLAGTIGRKLGLEEVDVQATNEAGTTGGVVTVGDRLGERLFVRLRQQFGTQEVTELLLEYRLSEFLRLQGTVAEGDGVGRANRSLTRRVERGGLDVVFYYRY